MAIDLGIDFGTSSTQIYNANEEKIIVDEPTVAVTRGESREVIAVGTEDFRYAWKNGRQFVCFKSR